MTVTWSWSCLALLGPGLPPWPPWPPWPPGDRNISLENWVGRPPEAFLSWWPDDKNVLKYINISFSKFYLLMVKLSPVYFFLRLGFGTLSNFTTMSRVWPGGWDKG